MRRDFMPRAAVFRRLAALHLQTQFAQLLFEPGNLLLLAGDDSVQFFQQIFTETQLDFDFSKACVHGGSRTLFRQHNNLDTVTLHGLPGTDFCGLAAFRLTIDGDFAVSDHVFALPAALRDTGEFQQIAKPDMFVLELKLADFHGIPEVNAGT
jgi:hypothetical protein